MFRKLFIVSCKVRVLLRAFFFAGLSLLFAIQANAQSDQRMVRLAKIEVAAGQLENYKAALNEQMQTAIKLEPGVLTYYAVADEQNPCNITILEIYADTAAYQQHIQTAHFKKYKATVAGMVKKLELVDVRLIGVAKQPGL